MTAKTRQKMMMAQHKEDCTRRLSYRKQETHTSSAAVTRRWLLIAGISLSLIALSGLQDRTVAAGEITQETSQEQGGGGAGGKSSPVPANHRMDDSAQQAATTQTAADEHKFSGRRNGRQYDSPLSASSTGNYAAFASDSGAGYAPSSLSAGSSASSALSGYSSDLPPLGPSGMYSSGAYGQASDQMTLAARAAGYPSMHAGGGGAGYPMPPPPPPFGAGPLTSMFPGSGGGLLGSGMFPLMAKGFDVSEIVCTAIAVAIGAVIVGAPFILLYLFVMNQMQGANGGPSAMGPNGGSISLTGPTSSTNVSGRKKRHTSLPEALFKQLSPLMNSEQVAQTFKALMNSISHYQA